GVDQGWIIPLGTIAPGGTQPVAGPPGKEPEKKAATSGKDDWFDGNESNRTAFLDLVRHYDWNRPEDRREIRRVAWPSAPHPGQRVTPKLDRHRGFRLVVAHLRYGPPPPTGKGTAYYNPERSLAAAGDVAEPKPRRFIQTQ